MTRPIRLTGRAPVYTREAITAGSEGVMTVRCVVTLAGSLESCRVLKSVPHMEQAVLEALATHRYQPATFQGQPVTVDYVMNIRLVHPRSGR
jgi:protein TonB